MSRSEDTPRVFRQNGVQTWALNYSKGALRYYQGLGQIISRHQITTVHSAFFNYFNAVPWLARLRGVKHILFTEYTSGVWEPNSWWKVRLACLRGRVANWPVKRVVAVSDFIKNRLVKIGIPPEKVVRAYLGVDSDHYTPNAEGRERLAQEYPLPPEDVILVAVSTFLPWKRVPVTVEACGLLAQRGVPVRLFLCGKGPQRDDLEEIARRFGIKDRVHFLGHIPNVVKVLQGADIFVHASTGEAFAFAVLEAMACGLPVVGSRSGGMGEAVVDGVTGLLATPLDPTSFADAVEKVALDQNLRRKMGAEARKRVERNFTLDIHALNMIRIYESVWNQTGNDR
jgi:glycosyltransferase involved in cell wall biosynthesis